MTTRLSASFIAILSLALSPAGTWKHEHVSNDGNVLTYTENGKVIFYMGCGRGFALATKYPGKANEEGDAEIAIPTSKGRMTFKGELEVPIEVKHPLPI
jgi:hypothetical protein